VRRIGGLADTVIDADADPRAGTGFVFGPAEPGALVDAVQRALAAMAEPARFRRIQAQGMARDHSWTVPARQYELAYQRALAGA
jgi:starch synthase